VPWAIYCKPEVAFAGHSEEAAKEAGFDVVVSKHRFAGNSRAMIIGETDGLVKIIAEKQADGTGGRVLGVHMVGPWVTEQLGQGYLAVNWEATVDEIARSSSPTPPCRSSSARSVLSMTGRSFTGERRRGRGESRSSWRHSPWAPTVRTSQENGAMADVVMPQLGESVTEGTITRGSSNPGDEVAEDEPLFEVSTDKVDTEVPSPIAGTCRSLRADEGDTVDVGTVIAVVGEGRHPADPPTGDPARPRPPAEAPSRSTDRAEPEPEPQPRTRPRLRTPGPEAARSEAEQEQPPTSPGRLQPSGEARAGRRRTESSARGVLLSPLVVAC
jgi:biotin carboxyl carrier protein